MQRGTLGFLCSQGTAWLRHSGSALLPRPRVKAAGGSSCATREPPAHAPFVQRPSGRRESWMVRVYFINCSLPSGVLHSSSWLHVVRAGDSESVLTLCLKHLDVSSPPPRSDIWVFRKACLLVLGRIMKWIPSCLSWCLLRESFVCLLLLFMVS